MSQDKKPIVRNRRELIEKGRDEAEKKARKDILDIVEETIRAIDPYRLVKQNLRLEEGYLIAGSRRIGLPDEGRVLLAGAGKACFAMAKAAAEVLGDRVRRGIFNVPTEPLEDLGPGFTFNVAGHPTPDQRGLRGAKMILEMAEEAKEGDVFIFLVSGGGSALLPYPAPGITLEDKKKLTSLLLASGASIDQVNVVRKHVSRIKGGWLAKAAYPATVVSLIVSDVVGDPVESIASGPTCPDPSTFSDCMKIVTDYGMLDELPQSIRKRLEEGAAGRIPETPKPGDPVFERTVNLVIGNNRIALEAAKRKAEELGYRSMILTDMMEGEAREIGVLVASIHSSISRSGLPLSPPALVIMGGETTVTLTPNPGLGGRNQELALSASRKIKERGLILSLATDGRDGPTDSAGAIVESRTPEEIREAGMDPERQLATHSSYDALRKIGAHLFTGYTGTNVCDVVYVLVP